MKFLKIPSCLILVVFIFGCATEKIFTYKDLGMENEK